MSDFAVGTVSIAVTVVLMFATGAAWAVIANGQDLDRDKACLAAHKSITVETKQGTDYAQKECK